MKEIDVRFDSGRDVLTAYWGYLSDGGLIIDDDHGLDEGQVVSLNVRIVSSDSSYSLSGKVVRRYSPGGQVVIAFRPGEPHDMLLTEALAETDNVPARRHRRYRLDVEARVTESENGAPVPVRVLNISIGGCCVRVEGDSRHALELGSRVELEVPDLRLEGEVVWARNCERGVRFESSEAAARDALESYLKRL